MSEEKATPTPKPKSTCSDHHSLPSDESPTRTGFSKHRLVQRIKEPLAPVHTPPGPRGAWVSQSRAVLRGRRAGPRVGTRARTRPRAARATRTGVAPGAPFEARLARSETTTKTKTRHPPIDLGTPFVAPRREGSNVPGGAARGPSSSPARPVTHHARTRDADGGRPDVRPLGRRRRRRRRRL